MNSVIYTIIATLVILIGVIKFRKGTINDDDFVGYFIVGGLWPIAFMLIIGWVFGGLIVVGLDKLIDKTKK